MERVMRNLTALPAFSASCFRAAASYSELLATKRRDCLGTDNWEHLQLAELINLYKCCYFMRCFSQSWSNSMPYWFNTLLYRSPDLSVTPAVINACLAHCFCVFLGKLDTEDWLALCNGAHVSLLEECASSRSQRADWPLCIPISRETQRIPAPVPVSKCHSVHSLIPNKWPVTGKELQIALWSFQLLCIYWFLFRFPEITWIMFVYM